MSNPTQGRSPDPLDQSVSPETREADGEFVAKRIFSDYPLSPTEVQRAAQLLWPVSGGAEYRKVLSAAMKKPKASWDSIAQDRREFCLSGAMTFHLSNADMERMALRTGACLMLAGETDLGRKIVEETAEADWKPPSQGFELWGRVLQLCVYAGLFAMIGFSSILSGYLVLIPIAAVSVAVGGIAAFLIERPKWKVEREEGEAKGYLDALRRLGSGARIAEVFAPDGTLRPLTP
jgi:hypothetical protein